ncbi:MAG: glycosyltransferase family 39 protein [Patescibacteria group bacterium]|nr:glycosyltransferase family 39 protein [Patescibacteria group bacterium]
MQIFSGQRSRNIFIAIIIAAAVLRFWNLGGPDMVTDEVYYALRGIGYLDYIGSTLQSTPLFWFDPLPSWTQLSMHDHPPLTFLVEHLFFAMFGVSVFVARLPFALAGIGSVFLIYLIGRKMFDERTGLIAAAVMAVSSQAAFVSRTALMEPLAIALILLTWYLFLLALEKPVYWYWWGAALGASFLAKYTAFPVLGVCLVYLLLFRRGVLKNFRFLAGCGIALALFSPVIIYNVMLYRTRGHFDLQFAALLHQNVPAWQTLTDKIPTSYWQNFTGIFTGLVDTYSPLALALAMCGFVYLLLSFRPRPARRSLSEGGSRNPVTPTDTAADTGSVDSRFHGNDTKRANYVLLFLFFTAYTLLLVLIKPLPRFLSYYLPVFPLLTAVFLSFVLQRWQGVQRVGLMVLVGVAGVYEFAYAVNTNLLPLSIGPANLTWSLVRPYTSDFGINKLDAWVGEKLSGKTSAGTPQTGTKPLDVIIQRNAAAHAAGKKPEKILLVYDTHLNETVTLWVFDRRFIYEGWPAYFADDFSRTVAEDGIAAFKGYTIYYVTGTEYSLWRRRGTVSEAAMQLEKKLVSQGFQPTFINNSVGLPVFKVYQFSL